MAQTARSGQRPKNAILAELPDDKFERTHDHMALLLAVTRPSVSLSANKLQRIGAVDYTQGRVTLTNRGLLEKEVCECYGIMRESTEA